MLTILGRLDRRLPLKLGKSVLTLTESTKKYPLTAENLRPRGRLRGGVKLVIDAPGASIMQHMVCCFWKSITFLERYIAKFFFAHKLFIYWSLHKKIPSPWIIFAWELCARKVFFGKKVVVFWKFVIFEATYNLQTPMEWPYLNFCKVPWSVPSFSGRRNYFVDAL